MSIHTTVKISSRNQIAIPSRARGILGLRPGDRLLVDIQDGMLILVPEPQDYVAALQGLRREVWQNINIESYLKDERGAWDKSDPG